LVKIFEIRTALFSDDRAHRYMLRIVWNEALPLCAFVGLNPSTADEVQDDPTIRRCKGFARDWRYGGILMFNLFAYRATLPGDMKAHRDPIGEQVDLGFFIRQYNPSIVVAAWGTHGSFMERGEQVRKQLSEYFAGRRLVCLGTNADGSPKHPLYLRKDSVKQEYGMEASNG
jgi:hypothetical protein